MTMKGSMHSDLDAMSTEDFITYARGQLSKPVSEFATQGASRYEGDMVVSVTQTTPAYEAGLLMLERDLEMLLVFRERAAGEPIGEPVGLVDRTALAPVIVILEASPYLGEAMMAEILKDVESLSAEPGTSAP
jgi:CBS domain-containing protein